MGDKTSLGLMINRGSRTGRFLQLSERSGILWELSHSILNFPVSCQMRSILLIATLLVLVSSVLAGYGADGSCSTRFDEGFMQRIRNAGGISPFLTSFLLFSFLSSLQKLFVNLNLGPESRNWIMTGFGYRAAHVLSPTWSTVLPLFLFSWLHFPSQLWDIFYESLINPNWRFLFW